MLESEKKKNSLLLSLLFLRMSHGEFYLEVAVPSCSANFIQSGRKNTQVVFREVSANDKTLNLRGKGHRWVFP